MCPFPQDQTPSSTPSVRDRRLRWALWRDPSRKDVLVTQETASDPGRPFLHHPVDARVVFALSVPKGALLSQPEFGLDRAAFARGGSPAQVRVRATDAVRVCLATLIDAGDIELTDVQVDASRRGTIGITVRYRNLRFQPDQVRLATAATPGA
jgi:hypothetical protein